MASLTSLSHEVLCRVCAYQQGVCEDMRPFLTLPPTPTFEGDDFFYWDSKVDPVRPFQAIVDALNWILPLWLETFSLNRLGRLFDLVARVREPILLWAANTARLDVLTWVHDRYDLRTCSDNLLAAAAGQLEVLVYLHSIEYAAKIEQSTRHAAIHGHVSSVAFLLDNFDYPRNWLNVHTIAGLFFGRHLDVVDLLLPYLVQDPILLRQAMGYAAAFNHLDLARKLHEHLVALNLQVDAADDAFNDALCIASSEGFVDGLTWLLGISGADPGMLAWLTHGCLVDGIRSGQQAIVNALMQDVSLATVTQLYLSEDVDGSLLDAAVDPNADVSGDDLGQLVLGWSVVKLCRVFNKFARLREPGPIRTAALKKCLHQVVSEGKMELVPWLVGYLTADDVCDVVCSQYALNHGAVKGGTPMLEFFESQGILLPTTYMDDLMYSLLCEATTQTGVPLWLQVDPHDDTLSGEDKTARWLVLHRGGPVAVLGRMFSRLVQVEGRHARLHCLALYEAWAPLVQEEEKKQVLLACQRERPVNAHVMEALVATEPWLFVHLAAIRRPLASLRALFAVFAKAVAPDELRRLKADAQVEATKAGQLNAAKFLAQVAMPLVRQSKLA
ncbi:Aste57867_891 [Aphanomyces stellatus]|uniref:Aste57867_891 protein n=1 Tax=Aphanomyces stellatus TaxID=120398 RepID=A0A485K449_9STRA|nr:hypothetical protein As57867_000890 [Aphanomyces stellatus]VFT78115.1 Aste57867_891 [Aphanomyces stellatus]